MGTLQQRQAPSRCTFPSVIRVGYISGEPAGKLPMAYSYENIWKNIWKTIIFKYIEMSEYKKGRYLYITVINSDRL
jgi:hypothetical protein